MCWALGWVWIHFAGIWLPPKWTYLKQPREVQSSHLRYQQGQRSPCRRVSVFASPLCSTLCGKDQSAGYSIPGLAIHHQEMPSITNCQILPSPRYQLRYLESRRSFYMTSVLPVVHQGWGRLLSRELAFPAPGDIRQGRGRQCWQVCSNRRMNPPRRCFPPPREMQAKGRETEPYSTHRKSAWREKGVSVALENQLGFHYLGWALGQPDCFK